MKWREQVEKHEKDWFRKEDAADRCSWRKVAEVVKCIRPPPLGIKPDKTGLMMILSFLQLSFPFLLPTMLICKPQSLQTEYSYASKIPKIDNFVLSSRIIQPLLKYLLLCTSRGVTMKLNCFDWCTQQANCFVALLQN